MFWEKQFSIAKSYDVMLSRQEMDELGSLWFLVAKFSYAAPLQREVQAS